MLMKRCTKLMLLSMLTVVVAIGGYIFFAEPWGPGPNGLWLCADHNHNGIVTRDEMALLGSQAPHRDAPRLMMHFDAADRNHDKQADQAEIDVYGVEIGSRDPYNQGR